MVRDWTNPTALSDASICEFLTNTNLRKCVGRDTNTDRTVNVVLTDAARRLSLYKAKAEHTGDGSCT